MSLKYNVRKIKQRQSYTLTEIARLFGVHHRTCGRWVQMGLKPIAKNLKPFLIMGFELKRFLKDMQNNRKTKLAEDEFYCLSCRLAVKAKVGSEKTIYTAKKIGKDNRDLLLRKGICSVCNRKINKYVKGDKKDYIIT